MLDLGTRDEYHAKIGYKILGKDECPFCDLQENKARIIWQWKYWYIIHNKYPYSWNEKHLMAVPYRHIKFSRELSQEEFWEMWEIHNKVKEFYGDEDYFSSTRESMGNRSIEHLHMHFIPGKLQGKYLRCMLENQWFPINAEIKIKK